MGSFSFSILLIERIGICSVSLKDQNNYNSAVFVITCVGCLFLMRCSNCGKCCAEIEMELSSDDIRRLEETGYRRTEFSVLDDHGIRLVNVAGWCFFCSLAEKNCRVYKDRPLGCRLYPVVCLADEGAVVDGLCPMGHSVSEREFKRKGEILVKLLKKIDDEGKCE